MTTVVGLTAARMLEIEAASIVDGAVVAGNLILEKHDGSEINAGSVIGPAGPQGPLGHMPGEIRMWAGAVLPSAGSYGVWTWANGGIFVIAEHPIAAAHIDDAWDTAMGLAAPGAGNFRVPDLRGLVPAGLDAMPLGAARANRMTRAVALIIASKTGEETHIVTVAETPSHNHGGATGGGMSGGSDRSLATVTDAQGAHDHGPAAGPDFAQADGTVSTGSGSARQSVVGRVGTTSVNGNHAHNLTGIDHLHSVPALAISSQGGGAGHETVQPTIMVPYIVKLDG